MGCIEELGETAREIACKMPRARGDLRRSESHAITHNICGGRYWPETWQGYLASHK